MNSTKISERNLKKEDVLQFLEKIESENVIIMPHEIADHDAYAASILLKKILEAYFSTTRGIYLYVPSISLELKEFLDKMNFSLDANFNMDEVLSKDYTVILVDIVSPQRFTSPTALEILNNAKRIMAIDHHVINSRDIISIVSNRTSTTEVVIEIAQLLNLTDVIMEDKKLVNLSIAAILTDTSMLYYANQNTFLTLSLLLSKGDYRVVYSALKGVKKSISERMARLKGAKRATITKIDDKILVVTRVGSYEASVASALVGLGANIAIVISEKKEKGKKYYRVSARSSGFDVSKIFIGLSKREGFEGGGHPTASGLIVDADKVRDINELVKILVDEVLKEISKK